MVNDPARKMFFSKVLVGNPRSKIVQRWASVEKYPKSSVARGKHVNMRKHLGFAAQKPSPITIGKPPKLEVVHHCFCFFTQNGVMQQVRQFAKHIQLMFKFHCFFRENAMWTPPESASNQPCAPVPLFSWEHDHWCQLQLQQPYQMSPSAVPSLWTNLAVFLQVIFPGWSLSHPGLENMSPSVGMMNKFPIFFWKSKTKMFQTTYRSYSKTILSPWFGGFQLGKWGYPKFAGWFLSRNIPPFDSWMMKFGVSQVIETSICFVGSQMICFAGFGSIIGEYWRWFHCNLSCLLLVLREMLLYNWLGETH